LKLKTRINAQEKQIKKQESIIKNLRDRNKLFKNKIQKQKRKTSKLQSKLDKLHYEYSENILQKKEISSKIKSIKNLQEKYNQEKILRETLEDNLNTLRKINNTEISKNSVPVKIVKSFTREGIREASKYWKIKKGDVILLSTSRGGGSQTALLIVQIGVKAVITTDSMSHQAKAVLEESNIPIISADRLDIKPVDEFAIIKDETLNKEIEKWKSKVDQVRKKEEKQKLLKVIDEYKAKRKREPFDD
jgi:predicted RNase H-like nuclease (RuvC/YqgF family)